MENDIIILSLFNKLFIIFIKIKIYFVTNRDMNMIYNQKLAITISSSFFI